MNSAISVKEQFEGRHLAQLGHIIVIALTPYCCLNSGKPANTNFIVFDPIGTRTRDLSYSRSYTTDAANA